MVIYQDISAPYINNSNFILTIKSRVNVIVIRNGSYIVPLPCEEKNYLILCNIFCLICLLNFWVFFFQLHVFLLHVCLFGKFY